jgi:hypothetical protein
MTNGSWVTNSEGVDSTPYQAPETTVTIKDTQFVVRRQNDTIEISHVPRNLADKNQAVCNACMAATDGRTTCRLIYYRLP